MQAVIMLLLLTPTIAANDPGHDSLYVLKIGDNATGSINTTGNLTATLVQATSRFFGPNLDIRTDGTSSAAPNQVIGTATSLELSSSGNLILNKGITGGWVYIGWPGTTTGLNVTGTILQQGIAVCLINGSNCPSTLPGSNISGTGTTNTLPKWTDTGTLGNSIITETGTTLFVSGSINLTDNITTSYARITRLLYGDHLDIRTNGTIQAVTSRPALQATANTLYIDGNGNLNINTLSGTTAVIQLGSTTTNGLTLNVSGTIRQQNIRVCLENGTNCPGTLTNANTTGTGTTNYLSKWTSATNIANSVLYDDGTNIGIGTSTPSARLEVLGTTNLTAGARITIAESNDEFLIYDGPNAVRVLSIGDGTSILFHPENTGAYKIGMGTSTPTAFLSINSSDPAGSLLVTNTTATHLIINASTGNIGIGTTSPTATLDLTTINNATTGLRLTTNSNTTNLQADRPVLELRNTNVSSNHAWSSNNYARIDFTAMNISGATKTMASISAIFKNHTNDTTSYNGQLAFFTTGSGTPTERMRIDENGNVVIVTSTPMGTLHVAGTVNSTGNIYENNARVTTTRIIACAATSVGNVSCPVTNLQAGQRIVVSVKGNVHLDSLSNPTTIRLAQNTTIVDQTFLSMDLNDEEEDHAFMLLYYNGSTSAGSILYNVTTDAGNTLTNVKIIIETLNGQP